MDGMKWYQMLHDVQMSGRIMYEMLVHLQWLHQLTSLGDTLYIVYDEDDINTTSGWLVDWQDIRTKSQTARLLQGGH